MNKLIVGALVALFLSLTTSAYAAGEYPLETGRQLADHTVDECATKDTVLADMSAASDATMSVVLAGEISGPAATAFAVQTGWNGETIGLVMLFAAVTPEGQLQPSGMVVIFSANTGCSVGSRMVPLDQAKSLMVMLDERSKA